MSLRIELSVKSFAPNDCLLASHVHRAIQRVDDLPRPDIAIYEDMLAMLRNPLGALHSQRHVQSQV